MRTARIAAVLVIAAPLTLAGCGPSESGARPPSGSSPAAAKQAPKRISGDLDPANGIKGLIAFGDAPDAAERAFGKPDRSEESRLNGNPSIAYAYDEQGLYLLFVNGGLYRIMVTSPAFQLPAGLAVGSTFREVDERCDRDRCYTPGAMGIHPFELRSNHVVEGRLYFAEGGRVYSFLAPSPNKGNAEGGSDEKIRVIALSAQM